MAFALVLLTNTLTIKISFIAIALAVLYPFTKRWTNLPQLILGLAFAMSVPMAFSAQTGTVPASAGWIFLATILWTLIYDTLYAMADREEDLKIGVKSTAILFAKIRPNFHHFTANFINASVYKNWKFIRFRGVL